MRSVMLAETEDFVIQFNPYITRVDWFPFKTGSLTAEEKDRYTDTQSLPEYYANWRRPRDLTNLKEATVDLKRLITETLDT